MLSADDLLFSLVLDHPSCHTGCHIEGHVVDLLTHLKAQRAFAGYNYLVHQKSPEASRDPDSLSKSVAIGVAALAFKINPLIIDPPCWSSIREFFRDRILHIVKNERCVATQKSSNLKYKRFIR